MKRRAVIDDAIGETRAAIYEGRRLVELHLERESTQKAPQTGDEYNARITSLEPSLNGAFVSLNGKENAFLSFSQNLSMPRLTEGRLISVKVSRPKEGSKLATVKYIGSSEAKTTGLVYKKSLKDRLAHRFPGIAFSEASVSTLDDAVERHIAIPGGGSITIEQTQALLAIDVDKGQGHSAFEVSLKAAELIASQLRLRGLGGLVVIDFPNLRQQKQRNQLFKAVERVFESDPATVKIAPLSRFGCIELTRSIDYPPLDKIMCDRYGRPTAETCALRALRQLRKEALSNRGAQLTLEVSQGISDWLNADYIDWKTPLNELIGQRYSLVVKDIEGFNVVSDR